MHFESEFIVPGTPDEVIELFSDLPRMAAFMPGASVEPRNEEGVYPGSLTVMFGPKKLVFKGNVRNDIDRTAYSGLLSGRGGTEKRGARIAVAIKYALAAVDAAQPPTTRVRLSSDAELFGILAEFASTAGATVANAMLEEFVRRFAASHRGAVSEGDSAAQNSQGVKHGAALGAGQLTRMVARSTWKSIKDRLSGAEKG